MMQGLSSQSGSNGSSAFSELADEDGPAGPASPAAGSRSRNAAASEGGGSGYGILESVRDEIPSTASQHWDEAEDSTENIQACLEQAA